MDALLILGGLLLILVGLVLLVMRGFATSLLWGWACLLPPLTLLFIVAHWRRAKHALACCALGMIPLVVGLAVMAGQDPQRLEAIIGLQWLQPEKQAPGELHIQLNGQLNGEPFAPKEGELTDSVLSLREGQDFFARRELIIRGLPLAADGLRLDVLPDDQGQLPEIEFSWLLPDQDLPEARQLKGGYTLHLDLRPEEPNRLVGDFHLVLPPQFETTLSGKVEVFRNGLRYNEGKVDRTVDSRDTLAHILTDYLQRRFATRDVQLEPLPASAVAGSNLMLEVQARVDGREQRLSVSLSKHPQLGWRVDDDRFAELSAASKQMPVAAPAQPAAPSQPAPQQDPRQDFTLVRLLSEPQRYVNQPMRVFSEKGNSAQGQFAGLDEQGQIILRQRLNGSGEARFALSPTDVVHVELLDE
ncbi:MFS transporter [Pseudomonas daroniae]|uniref:MFS transporter n=2 Tax=Phytopseudomonas daroniae TaxID=2487519 RepID=A0A4Q9QFQ4_9GAMM|nr:MULTISPECIES: MFS transporter [Pseudomonas]TBU71042.1 MFS transporter [Pseudomonas daroniae]TBU73032.1 MFS transporter [Pseudomonas sp. FRB 228]TBU85662.1 MFS transporter [Pseudomonas daroniae]